MSEQKLKIRIVIKPPEDVPAPPTPPEPDHKTRRMAVAIFLGLAAAAVIAVLGWQYLRPGAPGDVTANKDEPPVVAQSEPQAAVDVTGSSEPAVPETPETAVAENTQGTPVETPVTETASIESLTAVDLTSAAEPAVRDSPEATLPERGQEPPTETPVTELDSEQLPSCVVPVGEAATRSQAVAAAATGNETAAGLQSELGGAPDPAKAS